MTGATRSVMVGLPILSVVLGSALSAAQRTVVPRAEALVEQAVAKAALQQKMVFVEFGASWCLPCRRLEAFLDAPEIKPVFDAHYVRLRITVWESREKAVLNNPGGEALMARWGMRGGIPFFAVLDRAGAVSGTGNDYPGIAREIQQFMALLDRTAPRMTATERAAISGYLEANSSPYGSIAGRVVDDRGQPIIGATVTLLSQAFTEGQWRPTRSRRVQTDQDGRYAMPQVDPGGYRVLAEASGLIGFHAGDPDLSGARTLTIERNQDRAGVDVAVASLNLGRIRGTALRSDGQPAAGSTVSAVLTDWPAAAVTTTAGIDGAFTLSDVPAGAHNVWVRLAASSGQPGAMREIGFTTTAMAAGHDSNLTVRTKRGAVLSGTIALDGPALTAAERGAIRIEAVAVQAELGAPRERLQSSILEGNRIEIRGVLGQRAIRVENLPAGWILERVQVGGKDVTDSPIDFGDETDRTDVVVSLTNRTGEIVGTALDAEGRARNGGVMIAFAADSSRWQYPSRFVKPAPVNDKSAYAIRSLPEGDYLVAWVPSLGPNWEAPESLAQLRGGATSVAVRAKR